MNKWQSTAKKSGSHETPAGKNDLEKLSMPDSVALANPAETPEKPNIVLVVVDDLGYADLGCYGSNIHRTPNIDALAKGGLRLTDFHTNGPVCSPTRAALMTGQYQQRSGIESAIGFVTDEGMPLSKITSLGCSINRVTGKVRVIAEASVPISLMVAGKRRPG